MPTVDRESFARFLIENAEMPSQGDGVPAPLHKIVRVRAAMAKMEPFFRYAEEQRFPFTPLKPLAMCAKCEIAKAISHAAGQEVKGVDFLSLRDPFPKPIWVTDEAYEDCIWNSLGDSDTFRVSLYDSHDDELWGSVRPALGDDLHAALKERLCIDLLYQLESSARKQLQHEPLILGFRQSIRQALMNYLGHMLLGDVEKALPFVKLLEVMYGAIPIGELKSGPGVWIVLCE